MLFMTQHISFHKFIFVINVYDNVLFFMGIKVMYALQQVR